MTSTAFHSTLSIMHQGLAELCNLFTRTNFLIKFDHKNNFSNPLAYFMNVNMKKRFYMFIILHPLV